MSFTTTTYQREFPGLSRLGLYASKIDGDGNCLFRSLSDQKFGYPTEHEVMRGNTIDYMRDHPEEFKGFIPVNPGGGTRRNPKRKNTQPTTVFTPTQEEIDRVWEQHLAYMAEGGTWGDNIELVAFARAYNVNIRIYVHDFAYNIFAGPEDPDREVLHIAWHKWEHYSSIRNIDGPHTGLPEVRVRAADPETEEKQEEMLANAPYALPWQIDVVSKSLPYLVDKTTIKKTLEEAKGNIDAAVSKLMDQEDGNISRSSTQESSSVEREPDSDDDEYWGPNKRRDRRVSKTTKSKDKKVPSTSHLASVEDSAEPKEPKEPKDIKPTKSRAKSPQLDADSERTWHSDSDDFRKPIPAPQKKGPVRIKLTLPKPPPELAEEEANKTTGKTKVKQLGPRPQHRKVHARDKKDMMKKAQKAARKERNQADAKSTSGEKSLPIIPKTEKKQSTSPELGNNMKILTL